MITEETAEGILIRPAVALPVEIYSPERRAEFLLSTATNEEEYQAARTDVVAAFTALTKNLFQLPRKGTETICHYNRIDSIRSSA
jgi:hypothetical protein